MLRRLSAVHQHWPLATPFRISRGTRHAAETVHVEIHAGPLRGRGESVPYARYGETIESVLAQVRALERRVAAGLDRPRLAELLPAGAARNALDCALWDLEARQAGTSVWSLLQQAPPPALDMALTVGLDTPERMHAAAARLAACPLIKIKVDATDPAAQVRAVRSAAPAARLIVDPNESWDLPLLARMQAVMLEARVELVEQPLPSDRDADLDGFNAEVPICADESCHVATDLPALAGRYQVVNIKLDKTGGLTGALELLGAARAQGFGVMVGCMICSSLSVAPAFLVARYADFVDLDGPLWLKADHPDGVRGEGGRLHPASGEFWGGQAATEGSAAEPAVLLRSQA